MRDEASTPEPCPHGLVLDTYGARCPWCDNPNYPMQVVGGLPIAPNWTDAEREAIDRNREANRSLVRASKRPEGQTGDTMNATATTDSVYEVPQTYGADGHRLEHVVITDENGRRWMFEAVGEQGDPNMVAEHLADADEHERAEWADGRNR